MPNDALHLQMQRIELILLSPTNQVAMVDLRLILGMDEDNQYKLPIIEFYYYKPLTNENKPPKHAKNENRVPVGKIYSNQP
ncbi:hypothetical protein ACFSKL_16000 [Belliella marina]|uniref:Uncharacterized protein n=1 Tax=Belliella marina TaxID=1644146 RepID=A0ABW4VQ13_9BACT